MAMGKRRRRPKQTSMCVTMQDLPRTAAHPFYTRLNQILEKHDFDGYVEGLCQRFYADEIGRPGLPPGRHFRLLLIGYFEGLDAERAIAWRAPDTTTTATLVQKTSFNRRKVQRGLARTNLDRPVVDHTGLRAKFDWEVQWVPEDLRVDAKRDDGPSIFQAFRDQLGLKLEATRDHVDVLVIDHVERPTLD